MKIPKQRLPKSIARQYAESIGIALILAVVMRSSFVEAYVIPSGSMEPTILVGDHIFVNKVAYGLRIPRTIKACPCRGFQAGSTWCISGLFITAISLCSSLPRERGLDLIKRVIGLPGDKVQVINEAVWRNGERIANPHAFFSTRETARSAFSPTDNFPTRDPRHPAVDPGPVVVPPGRLFMMGDNRDDSFDSRFWGFADERQSRRSRGCDIPFMEPRQRGDVADPME